MGRFARDTGRIITGLRIRLLLLVVLVCAPFVGLILHTAWEDRRRARTEWWERSQKMVQVAMQEEDKLINATRQLLLAIAESPPIRSGSQRATQKLVDHLFPAYSHYSNLGVITTNGQVFASAVPRPRCLNAAESKLLAQASTSGFTIGPLPSTAPPTTMTVVMGQPFFNKDHIFQGVVYATVHLTQQSRYGTALRELVPKGAMWTEIGQTSSIIARYPEPDKWHGRSMSELWLADEIADRQEGIAEGSNSMGVPTVFAFSTIPCKLLSGGNTVGILSIPTQKLFAEANRALWMNLAWLGLAAGVALVLGYFGSNILVLHPVKGLAKLSSRLASGDLKARTGLPYARDELGQLSKSFDQMAQALEVRELEQKKANRKLQVLSRRLVEVQEAERRHIARELHDEVGQSLTAAELNLQSALESVTMTAAKPRLRLCSELIERVLEQVHDMSLSLRPSILDDLGLEPAIRWYTDRQASVLGIDSCFEADALEERLDPVIETECFRVAQEALTNVAKHARASWVKVALAMEDGRLHLRVTDDGVGFEVLSARETAVRGASLGLLSMEERAVLAGGGFELKSAPGRGTEIRAWFPLRKRKPSPTV